MADTKTIDSSVIARWSLLPHRCYNLFVFNANNTRATAIQNICLFPDSNQIWQSFLEAPSTIFGRVKVVPAGTDDMVTVFIPGTPFIDSSKIIASVADFRFENVPAGAYRVEYLVIIDHGDS